MKVSWTRVVLLLITLLLMGCATQRLLNLNEGVKSFKLQNYRDAFVRLKPEAARGNPDAQYAVGYMYYYGNGVVEDRHQAIFWIRLAACQKQIDAIAALKLIQEEYECS